MVTGGEGAEPGNHNYRDLICARLYRAHSEEPGQEQAGVAGGLMSRWRKWGLYVLYTETESIHENI